MKKIILLSVMVLAVYASAIAGLNEKLSASTQLFIAERNGEISLDIEIPGPKLMSRAPLLRTQPIDRFIAPAERINGVDMVSAFIHINPNYTSKLESYGVEIQGRFNDFVVAMIPVDKIERVAEIAEVREVNVARKMKLMTNMARSYTNTDDVLNYSNDAITAGLPQAFKGTGVVVGVIDQGIDFQHTMFKDSDGNSRIKRAYVARGSSSFTTYTSVTSSSPTTDYSSESHGTHTSTTAGGSNITYSNTTYGGMAPEANLVLVGCGQYLYNTNIALGIQYIFNYADSQNMPAVCSISLGSHMGPHDGTGELASVYAQYAGSNPNHIIVNAAGNEAGSSYGTQYSGGESSSGSPFTTVLNGCYYPYNGYGSSYLNRMYYGYDVFYARTANKALACKLHVVDTSAKTIKWTSSAITSSTSSVSGITTYFDRSPSVTISRDSYSNKYYVQLYFSQMSQKSSYQSSKYALAVSVYPTSGSCIIDSWDVSGYNAFGSMSGTYGGFTFTAGTDDCSIGDEGGSSDIILVGAYVSKKSVTDYNGSSHTLSGTIGNIAYYSSYQAAGCGPTGIAKPDICAPGSTIVAGINHYDNTMMSNGYADYGMYLVSNNTNSSLGNMDGTSMATPCAAGIIALYLQAAKYAGKTLNTEGIRDVFANTAIQDSYTTKKNFGPYGKIDALAGIQYILSGVSVDPVLTVDPTSLSFTDATTGQSYTKTFTVSGTRLSGNVNLSVSGSSDFTVSPSTLTAAQAAAGATVTVTYTPSAAGTQTATVTASSAGAESVSVSLTGTSTNPPTITLNKTELTFSTTVGTSVKKTFTVKGSDLTGNVSLSVTGEGFSIDKTTVGKNTAMSTNGSTVTVTYNPTAAGTHSGLITITSPGAETKTVTLNGTATDVVRTITVNPTSLSFNATVGETATKTFTVTGSNLNGNLTLALNNANGIYSIDKTSITAAEAANGATVTVTYNPSVAGNSNASVTVSGGGADSKTVNLSGTATDVVRTITVNPASLSFNSTVGVAATKTFTVTGSNLNSNLTLTLNNANGIYSISRTSIPAAEANNGVTITVTYNPAVAGNSNASVTVSGGGAESKTVNLSGTAVAPVITADPTSLTFSAVEGETQTQTFTVTGANLTGNLSLALNNANGVYSISRTSITAAEAANGVTVTVTYNPAVAGTYNASVTISGGGAQPVTVNLNGTAVEPARTITVSTDVLNMNTIIGEPQTATFTVTGENLNGNLTLTLNDANGIYSINPTTISAADAANGVTVTVTYTPTTFGNQTASIVISGGGANPVTVNLNGTANITKFAPVMLQANDAYVALTRFRAEWTDETPTFNVSSYTLEVTPKVVVPVMLSSIDGTSYTSSYTDITLTAPWGGERVRGGQGAIYFRNNYNNDGIMGNITYTVPDGYTNATFTLKITSGSDATNGKGNLTVATPQTAAVTHYFAAGETYYWVVTASSGEKITITTPDDKYSPDIALIEVYTGDASAMTLMAIEQGGADSRLITEIDPGQMFYTVNNLAEGGTFLYRVKALYIDGTESDWSNIEEVTLHENAHPYAKGDVNHDEKVDIDDVTTLINGVLGNSTVCPICGDVNGDEKVDIDDVTNLINMILGNASKMLHRPVK